MTASWVTSEPVMGIRVRAGAAAEEVILRSGWGTELGCTETGGGVVYCGLSTAPAAEPRLSPTNETSRTAKNWRVRRHDM